jgi:hypothetical protein
MGRETAPDQSASCWGSPVSVVRMAVAPQLAGLAPVSVWASGSTGFNTRSGMMALTVMQQALRKKDPSPPPWAAGQGLEFVARCLWL